jgi:hypothetical protein
MNNNIIEIIIQVEDKKRVAVINISADDNFGLKEYTFAIKETLKKTKRSLFELAIENELKKLDKEEGEDGKK